MDLYSVTPSRVDYLLTLLRDVDQPAWLEKYVGGLPGEYSAYVQFEAEATVVSNWDGQVVPGLLQTADYARAIIEATAPELAAAGKLDQLIEARMARQQLLRKDPPLHLCAVIDESVLHRLVGGPVIMKSQLDRLTKDAARPNTTLQVIPYEVG